MEFDNFCDCSYVKMFLNEIKYQCTGKVFLLAISAKQQYFHILELCSAEINAVLFLFELPYVKIPYSSKFWQGKVGKISQPKLLTKKTLANLQ